VIRTQRGLLVITGCAHPGIIYMLDKVKRDFGGDFYLVLGGFHLFNLAEEEIENIIGQFKEKGVLKSAPAHCSGDKARGLFEKKYGSDFIRISVGARVIVE
jgi:7,8-dihydropterin-6-yl-methyl-4-(beta-D-ribofuranosyl)aminobenzene 5'-phosphate synthase